jgi:hypothetical protein
VVSLESITGTTRGVGEEGVSGAFIHPSRRGWWVGVGRHDGKVCDGGSITAVAGFDIGGSLGTWRPVLMIGGRFPPRHLSGDYDMVAIRSGGGGRLPACGVRFRCSVAASQPPCGVSMMSAVWRSDLELAPDVWRLDLVLVRLFLPPPTPPLAAGYTYRSGCAGLARPMPVSGSSHLNRAVARPD